MAAFPYGDREPASYLGFGLDISQATVKVTTPDGRPLGEERTLSAARRLVRGNRNEKQSRSHSQQERATGSNRKEA